MKIEELSKENIIEILPLVRSLNPELKEDTLYKRQDDMFKHTHYLCFGMFLESEIIAVSSAWTTVRFYSGKQLELDNVVVKPSFRSKGIGNTFIALIENWAVERGYKTIELNSYVDNTASHKFYQRRSYRILGHHFQKKI